MHPAPSSWAVLLCFFPFPYSQGPYALPGRAWTGNVVKVKGAAGELKPSPYWTKESPASGPTRQELPAYHVSCSALLTWGSERPTLMPQGLFITVGKFRAIIKELVCRNSILTCNRKSMPALSEFIGLNPFQTANIQLFLTSQNSSFIWYNCIYIFMIFICFTLNQICLIRWGDFSFVPHNCSSSFMDICSESSFVFWCHQCVPFRLM